MELVDPVKSFLTSITFSQNDAQNLQPSKEELKPRLWRRLRGVDVARRMALEVAAA